jgi:hypothetical protein
MCCVWISEQAATFALYNIKRLGLYNRGGECLLSGTHPLLILNGHVSSVNDWYFIKNTVYFSEHFNFIVHIFTELVTSKWPS